MALARGHVERPARSRGIEHVWVNGSAIRLGVLGRDHADDLVQGIVLMRKGENAGRGANDHASDGVITNGSKIIVPEGYGLVLMEDGAFTGFAAQPGGYVWDSDDTGRGFFSDELRGRVLSLYMLDRGFMPAGALGLEEMVR